MVMKMGELWNQIGSVMASLMFVWAVFQQFFPYHLRDYAQRYAHKLIGFVYPYIQITFHEYSGGHFNRSEAYDAIQSYLSKDSSARAKRLKANPNKGSSKSLVLSMDDHEEISDDFEGVKVWWQSNKSVNKSNMFSIFPASDEKRFYKLTFHRRHRKLITESYLEHVLSQGKMIQVKNRERKLYSNNPSDEWSGWRQKKWSHVPFEHPATFDTLAMEKKKKEEIMKDLLKFSKGKEYYKRIGKAWKRGYLLYGPPGTGKSTMIAAMANFLSYDVYDLELTTVKNNTELRKLLIETSRKSIIVIEDIDCSLDLTGQRSQKEEKDSDDEDEKEPVKKELKKKRENKDSKVTLSGLLNFIDGLWSACGGERIIVFTTNFVEKLDPALIRRGRMDKHIEMSYCCFEAFEILAQNYLDIESHDLYGEIKRLLGETDMSPADVGENLLPKSEDEDAETCLKRLIEKLEEAKVEAKRKAEEEAKQKAEEEEKKKKKEKKEKEEAEEEEEKTKKKEKKKEEAEEEEKKKMKETDENGKDESAQTEEAKKGEENGVIDQ